MATVPELVAVRGVAFTFYLPLTSQADTDTFQTNPTLAVGDVKLSTDGGALDNITTLPVVSPAGGQQVQVDASADEMDGAHVGILFHDENGDEWQDIYIGIRTELAQAVDVAETGANGDTLETLSDQIDGIGAAPGSGAITWPYTLTNAISPFEPIADADVWVTTDEAGDNVIASGKTDASGEVTFYLDEGTVYVWRQKSGWNFDNPDTEVVS